MHIIQPMISTFDDALKHIHTFGRPGALFFDDAPQSFVLSGGSLRHPVWITLTYAVEGHKNFGHYISYECHRLIVRDDRYRTKYHLDPDEHAELKTRMAEFCREHRLRVKVLSQITRRDYLAQAAQEFFAGFDVKWKVYGPRPSRSDRLAIESAAQIVEQWLSRYPADVFIQPEPGQRGKTVDACSAAALRAVLPNIAADIRRLADLDVSPAVGGTVGMETA